MNGRALPRTSWNTVNCNHAGRLSALVVGADCGLSRRLQASPAPQLFGHGGDGGPVTVACWPDVARTDRREHSPTVSLETALERSGGTPLRSGPLDRR